MPFSCCMSHVNSHRLANSAQIVVGVLLKYVNLGSGWRHRLFVLHEGVLRYYKVGGQGMLGLTHHAEEDHAARCCQTSGVGCQSRCVS